MLSVDTVQSQVHRVDARDDAGFSPAAAEYLTRRACDLKLAKREGLRSFDEDEIRALHSWARSVQGEVLCIAHGAAMDGLSYDRLQLLDREKNKSKTLCEPGRTPPPFILSTMKCEQASPLFIVEAAPKAIALASQGWDQVVGLGGIEAGFFVPRAMRAHEEVEEVQPMLEPVLVAGRTVHICFDAGRVLNPLVAAAEARIARFLLDRGHQVRLIEIPVTHDGKDQGPDDYLASQGQYARGSFDTLIKVAIDADPVAWAQHGAKNYTTEKRRALLQHLPFLAAIDLLWKSDEKKFELVRDTLSLKGQLAAAVKRFRAQCAAKRREEEIRARPGPPPLAGSKHVDLAKAYLEERAEIVGSFESAIHVYVDGVWLKQLGIDERNWISSNLHGRFVLREDKDPYVIGLSKGDIEGTLSVATDRGKLTWDSHVGSVRPIGVAFRNGFLELVESDDPVLGTRIDLLPPSPRNGATSRHEFDYSPDAEAPKFRAFLESLFVGAPDAADRIAALQEFAGAALFGIATRYKRALFLDGEGDSGKSQVIKIFQAMMPAGTTVSIPLDLMSSEYSRAQFSGALLNTVAELNNSEWLSNEWFKSIVAGDTVHARHPYGQPAQVTPRAAHIFATNGLPRIADRSTATTNRMLVVRFNRRFVVDPVHAWQGKATIGIAEEIVKTEVPGIVAWAVDGALRLIRQRTFTVPATGLEAVNELRTESDPVRQFAEQTIVVVPEQGKPVRLYSLYKAWAEDNGVKPASSAPFGRSISRYIRQELGMPDDAVIASKTHGGVMGYHHVQLKEPPTDATCGAQYDHLLGAGDRGLPS